MDWKPISEAPKDGRLVLLWEPPEEEFLYSDGFQIGMWDGGEWVDNIMNAAPRKIYPLAWQSIRMPYTSELVAMGAIAPPPTKL